MLHAIMTGEAWWALGQVIMIDLVLAGDNAVVIGLAAAGLPKEQRNKAILVGIIAATVLRIAFASVTLQLLEILGLLLVGGILLLWVCWKMWRELRDGTHEAEGVEAMTGEDFNADGTMTGVGPKESDGPPVMETKKGKWTKTDKGYKVEAEGDEKALHLVMKDGYLEATPDGQDEAFRLVRA